MVTHEDDIAAYAERKIVIRDGQITEDIRTTSCQVEMKSYLLVLRLALSGI